MAIEHLSDLVNTILPQKEPPKKWWKFFVIGAVVIVVVVGAAAGAAAAYVRYYAGKVYPGVYFENYALGGMSEANVRGFIENANNRYAKEGIRLTVKDKTGAVRLLTVPTVVDGEDGVQYIQLDSEDIAGRALAVGRSGSWWHRALEPWRLRFGEPTVLQANPTVDDTTLTAILHTLLAPWEDAPHNATVRITAVAPLQFTVVPETSGYVFDYPTVKAAIVRSVSNLSFQPAAVAVVRFNPDIGAGEVSDASVALPDIVRAGPLQLTYNDPATLATTTWEIAPVDFSRWIEPERGTGGQIVFGLSKSLVEKYLDAAVRPVVDRTPTDAKFVMVNNKVQEFKASSNGLSLNDDVTYAAINAAFQERTYQAGSVPSTVAITVDPAEPTIKTADVNSLGITDILGAGTSTFHDSFTNRIKNIAHAVERLNGVIIKPGEEFSTIHYAGPFTADNGYLPEQVIKGDEIKKEIGGGMCQIGTTLFRMAMNSGMPITERRNHSLVVHYYADPVNHNPGTDATVYEPILDFKFLNDTGNYVLLQTNIDYKKQMLTFTLWGKPDGRQGWYTHPLVSKWIPAGDPKEEYVTDGSLKPGEKKCQGAFKGAVASFVYTRITPDGQKIDREFDSYYRPLPQICMIGAPVGFICSNGTSCPVPPGTNISASSTPSGAIIDSAQ